MKNLVKRINLRIVSILLRWLGVTEAIQGIDIVINGVKDRVDHNANEIDDRVDLDEFERRIDDVTSDFDDRITACVSDDDVEQTVDNLIDRAIEDLAEESYVDTRADSIDGEVEDLVHTVETLEKEQKRIMKALRKELQLPEVPA
jgi:hypothetical protein